MTTLSTLPTRAPGGLGAAWRSAHDPVDGVPRWAHIAALTTALLVLPSSIWRIAAFTFHVPLVDTPPAGTDINGDVPQWFPMELYVIVLSVLSEALAFLAIGMIARWGEVFPRWLPGLRGRRVPISVAVIPAAIGSLILTLLWAWATITSLSNKTLQLQPLPPESPFVEYDWQFAVAAIAYLPLVAWGPLLGAVTVAYYRRRRS